MIQDPNDDEQAALEIGYQECAAEALVEAVQRFLSVSPLEDVLDIVAETCETLAVIKETSDLAAERWEAAGEAIRELIEDEAIKDAP